MLRVGRRWLLALNQLCPTRGPRAARPIRRFCAAQFRFSHPSRKCVHPQPARVYPPHAGLQHPHNVITSCWFSLSRIRLQLDQGVIWCVCGWARLTERCRGIALRWAVAPARRGRAPQKIAGTNLLPKTPCPLTTRGVTRLDGARGKKFGAPIFEPEVFWKQMYCTEEVTCEIVGALWYPHSDSAPMELCPPRYAPADDGRVPQSSRMWPTFLKLQDVFIARLNRMWIMPRKTWTILETLQRRNLSNDKKSPRTVCATSRQRRF